MKYNALAIKSWIMQQLSPIGWSTLITRALPELLEHNERFSAFYIGKKTKWDDTELEILQYYLRKMFGVSIPDDLLADNGSIDVDYLDLIGLNFFDGASTYSKFKNAIKNFFNSKIL